MNAPRLWLVHLWASAARIAALWSTLDADERATANRFVFPHLRTRYVVAHAALRRLVADHRGRDAASLRWQLGPHGKPRLADDQLELNLSHCGDWGLVAIGGRRPLGVDIEGIRPRRVSPSMIDEVSSATERAAFDRMDESQRVIAFFRLWVRKESVLKALGTGLSRSLASVDVPLAAAVDGDLIALRPRPAPDRCWRVWDVPVPLGYVAAIVVEHDAREPSVAPEPPRIFEL